MKSHITGAPLCCNRLLCRKQHVSYLNAFVCTISPKQSHYDHKHLYHCEKVQLYATGFMTSFISAIRFGIDTSAIGGR